MALSDPVSCLLCLDAFERSTMLRVVLKAIAGGDPHLYCFCQRCGGAIAAEYLYVQQSGKSEPRQEDAHPEQPSGETWDDGLAHEREPGFMQPPIESATAGVGEEKTIEATAEIQEIPAEGKKKGRKESH